METKAFRAYLHRTSYILLEMVLKDYIVIIISFLFTAAIFISYFIFKFPGRII